MQTRKDLTKGFVKFVAKQIKAVYPICTYSDGYVFKCFSIGFPLLRMNSTIFLLQTMPSILVVVFLARYRLSNLARSFRVNVVEVTKSVDLQTVIR